MPRTGRIRRRISYANAVATIALVVALASGTALAAVVVHSNADVAPNTIAGHHPPSGDHANLVAGSVAGSDLAANAVTGAKVADYSLTGTDLRNGSLTATQIDAESLDPVLQHRVTGGCAGGNGTGAIQHIGRSGPVTCAVPAVAAAFASENPEPNIGLSGTFKEVLTTASTGGSDLHLDVASRVFVHATLDVAYAASETSQGLCELDWQEGFTHGAFGTGSYWGDFAKEGSLSFDVDDLELPLTGSVQLGPGSYALAVECETRDGDDTTEVDNGDLTAIAMPS